MQYSTHSTSGANATSEIYLREFREMYSRPYFPLQLVHQLRHLVHVLPVLVGRELHLLHPPVALDRVLMGLPRTNLGLG